MEIVTFKPKNFEGHDIYIRRIGTYFEYVVMIGRELYSSHKIVQPTIFERLLYWMRIRKDYFNHEQLVYIQKYLETLAMGTIREVTKPNIQR